MNKVFFIAIVMLIATGLSAQSNADEVFVENLAISEASSYRSEVIEFAKTYLGTAYKYASLDPSQGFDCSGFVYYVFNHFNINLPRSSRQYKLLGDAKSPDEFKVGDVLVFYGFADSVQIGHVGIICEADGMKSKFIHSSSGKANGITISELGSEAYTRRFYKCIDVLN